jgi:hypothetical protein
VSVSKRVCVSLTESGSGVFAGANGDRYEGEWIADRKHGFGRIFFASRETGADVTVTGSGAGSVAGISKLKFVEGTWEHDQCCGSGKAVLADGECGWWRVWVEVRGGGRGESGGAAEPVGLYVGR